MSEDNKFVRMANQIATFFHSQPDEDGPKAVATHINKFWEPRMRRALLEIAEQADNGLDPMVVEAIPQVRRPPEPVKAPAAG